MSTHLQTAETTIYKKIHDELVVVQLDTAHYYYFSPETETVLQFFKTPKTISEFVECAGESRSEELQHFCKLLLDKQILKTSAPGTEKPSENIDLTHVSPAFLREGEKTIDEISFYCP